MRESFKEAVNAAHGRSGFHFISSAGGPRGSTACLRRLVDRGWRPRRVFGARDFMGNSTTERLESCPYARFLLIDPPPLGPCGSRGVGVAARQCAHMFRSGGEGKGRQTRDSQPLRSVQAARGRRARVAGHGIDHHGIETAHLLRGIRRDRPAVRLYGHRRVFILAGSGRQSGAVRHTVSQEEPSKIPLATSPRRLP